MRHKRALVNIVSDANSVVNFSHMHMNILDTCCKHIQCALNYLQPHQSNISYVYKKTEAYLHNIIDRVKRETAIWLMSKSHQFQALKLNEIDKIAQRRLPNIKHHYISMSCSESPLLLKCLISRAIINLLFTESCLSVDYITGFTTYKHAIHEFYFAGENVSWRCVKEWRTVCWVVEYPLKY